MQTVAAVNGMPTPPDILKVAGELPQPAEYLLLKSEWKAINEGQFFRQSSKSGE
jgi:hypothetical protein